MKCKSLKTSLLILFVVVSIAITSAVSIVAIINIRSSTDMSYTKYEDAMYNGYRTEIKSQIQASIAIVKSYYDAYKKGDYTEDQAKNLAKEAIRNMRYRDDGSGYMWIDTTDYILLMHPILAKQEGTNRYELKDQNGVMIIQEIMKVAKAGGGYNSFYFTKADGVTVAPKLAYSEMFEPWGWVITTGNYTDDMDAEMVDVKNEISASYNKMEFIIAGVGVLVIVICIVLSVIYGNIIVNPVLKMQNMALRLSQGDLSEDLIVKEKNEIGKTAASLNTAQENIKALIRNISDVTNELESTVSTFSSAFMQMTASITEVSTAVDDITMNVNDQAESTKEAAEEVNAIGTGITNTGSEIHVLDNSSKNISKLSDKSSNTLHELVDISTQTKVQIDEMYSQTALTNESVQKIKNAANVINDIAEQTDLLALNASIEAARAGESGRGFAVVAEQIAGLAKQSADNVVEIGTVVDELLVNSERSLKIMDEMKSQMQEQNSCITDTEADFTDLSASLLECTNSIEKIDIMTNEIEVQRQGVTNVLVKLNEIAQNNAASTQETSAMTEELTILVNNAKESITHLNASVDLLSENVQKFTI